MAFAAPDTDLEQPPAAQGFSAPKEDLEGGFSAPKEDIENHVQGLIQDPKFDAAKYALQTGDQETAFQARQALRNRSFSEKAAAFGNTLTQPETYVNAAKGVGKFAAGLIAAPLHGTTQALATAGAPVARMFGADNLANTLENEQQTQGAESTLAGQQVEEGLKGIGRGIRNTAQSAYRAATGTPEDEATEREHFQAEIEATRNAQSLAASKPLETGAVAGAAKLATGNENLSDVYSPEALREQGARPVSSFITESMAAAGDLTNLAIPLAGKIPGVKTAAGGIVQAAGKVLQAPEGIMSAIPKFARFGHGTGALGTAYYAAHHPAAAAMTAGIYGLGKVLGFAGRALDEQGAAFRTGVPSALDATAQSAASAGESALGTNVQRTIGNTANNVVATALGFAPINYVTSGGDPRKFAESEVGVAAMGGVFGLAGERGRLEDIAKQRLAQYGSQQFNENPLWQAHQAAMQTLSPSDQAQINTLRGTLHGGTGTDVLVLDGPTFAKQVGAIGGDARGQYAQDGSTIYLNKDAIGQGGPTNAAGHEAGHAIADFLKNAGREGDAQALFSSIAGNMTPEQVQALTSEYTSRLAKSTKGYDTANPEQKAAIEAKIQQDNPPEKIIEENIAEITRRILSGRSIASFALPQPFAERLTDAAARFMENRGWMPKVDESASLGFKAQMVNEAARRMNSILYETGKQAVATMDAGPTVTQKLIEARAKLAAVPPITPNMPIAKASAIQRQRDAAQKELNELQGLAGNKPATEIPQTTSPDTGNLNRYRIAAILRQQGLNQTDAKQWADAAEGKTDEEAVVDALRKRAQQKFPTTSTLEVKPGQTFNDENGIAYKVTGENTEPPRIGDTVVATDGKAYRVTKAWDNGSVDVAYTTSPLNTRSANTLRQGSFKRVNVEPDVQPANSPQGQQVSPVTTVSGAGGATTPQTTAPVAAGAQVAEGTSPALTVKPAGGGRFVIIDPAGNPINQRTYASEASANAAIRQRGGKQIPIAMGPGGAPDILNHIGEMGGISPKKATQEYNEMPALHRGYSAILGGTEAPEDLARDLYSEHNIGDGSVSTMWKLVQDAMNTRASTTTKAGPTEAAQERQGREQAEAHVADLLQRAESDAVAKEKNTKTKAAQDRIQRAKINAILDDIGDDPTGMHRVTDQFGNESIIGTYDPTDPRHKALADMGGLSTKDGQKVAKIQNDTGNVIYMRYRSALSNAEQAQGLTGEATRENVETGMGKRQEEYSQDPAAERTQGTIQQKAVIPVGTELNSPSGKLTMRFAALDNILHNLASIFEGMKQIGYSNPYGDSPVEQEPLMVKDAQAYAQNHAHGYKGDGSGPIQTFPDSGLPTVDPNYTPQEIPADRFAVLNMAFANESAGKLSAINERIAKYQAEGKNVPKSVLAQQAKAQEQYSLASENNPWVDHQTGETNQLRAELKAAGFDTQDRLKNPFETLAPQHILEISDKPIASQPGDVPSVRPTGFNVDPAELGRAGLPKQKAVAAGFLPTEDTGKPEDGTNPSDRLGREAEQAGIMLSMATLRGLIREDPATMESIRKRIQDKTGKPARFMPGESYNPESDKSPIIEASDPPWLQRFSQLYQKEQKKPLSETEEDELDGLHKRIDRQYGSLSAFDRERKQRGIVDTDEPLREHMRGVESRLQQTKRAAEERMAARQNSRQ